MLSKDFQNYTELTVLRSWLKSANRQRIPPNETQQRITCWWVDL